MTCPPRSFRRTAGLMLAALAALAIDPLVAVAHADVDACRRQLVGAAAKLTQAAARAQQRCRDAVVLGKLPSPTDCRTHARTEARVAARAAKLRATVDRACGGPDRDCATTADNVPLASLGFDVASCPNLVGGGCGTSIGHCGDVATCVACVGRESMADALALVYDDFVAFPDGATRTCQRALGKTTAAVLIARSQALRTCALAVLAGKAAGPCPDGAAAAAIAAAEAKRDRAVCLACGGADRSCGGGDDLAAASIGFPPACPEVTAPEGAACAAVPATLGDVRQCVDCVGDHAGACAAAIAAPAVAAYPAACVPGLTAVLSAPASADANASVLLDGTASIGDVVSYHWDFGHGSPMVTTTTPSVSHRFGAFGTFTVSLTVVDDIGATDTATRVITTTGFGPDNYMVKPVYFVPANRTPYPDWEQRFQTAMTLIDQFFAASLERAGYGYRPLNYEKDANGRPVIHLIHAAREDDYYLPNGVYDTGGAQERVQAELEPQFDMETSTLLIIADIQWYDPAFMGDVAPWTGGRGAGRGGMAFVGSPLRWLGTSIAEQLVIFDDMTIDADIGPRERGANASILLGGMAHELAHALGTQHTDTWGDLMSPSAFAIRNFFIDGYGDAPYLITDTARVLDNSAMFRSDHPFADDTPPSITLLPELVLQGQPFALAPTFTDGGSGPALFLMYFNGVVADSYDVRGLGAAFDFPFTMTESFGLPEGNYPFGYVLYDGDSNRFESSASFQVVSSIPPAPPAVTVDPTEWVWAEDAREMQADTINYWAWQSTIKASGNLALYQETTPSAEGFHSWYGAWGHPMVLAPGDHLTAWVYIVPGAAIDGIALELGENIGGGVRAWWGTETFDWDPWSVVKYRIGDLPPAGGWVHLSVPVSALGITSPRTFVNGGMRCSGTGRVVWDRFGKKPGF